MRDTAHTAIVLSFLLVAAGCATTADPTETAPGGTEAPSTPSPTEPSTPAPSPTATPSPTPYPEWTPKPTSSPTSTLTPTPEPPDNPWKQETLTVGFDPDGSYHEYTVRAIKDAIDYWNRKNSEYGTYQVALEYDRYADDHDLVFRLQDEVTECGGMENELLIGCGPVIPPHVTVGERPQVVIFEGLHGYCTTKEVLKHELGHMYGLGHDDEPQPLMNATINTRGGHQATC